MATANCGVVWSECSTSRGPEEDAGDGGWSDVSRKQEVSQMITYLIIVK
jgi:hypothetical protein